VPAAELRVLRREEAYGHPLDELDEARVVGAPYSPIPRHPDTSAPRPTGRRRRRGKQFRSLVRATRAFGRDGAGRIDVTRHYESIIQAAAARPGPPPKGAENRRWWTATKNTKRISTLRRFIASVVPRPRMISLGAPSSSAMKVELARGSFRVSTNLGGPFTSAPGVYRGRASDRHEADLATFVPSWIWGHSHTQGWVCRCLDLRQDLIERLR
jgi:hypothetical protein